MDTLVAIAATAVVFSVLLFLVFGMLARRIAAQKDNLHELSQKYERLVSDLAELDRRVLSLPGKKELQAVRHEAENTARELRVYRREVQDNETASEARWETFRDQMDHRLGEANRTPATNPLVIDSPLVKEVIALLEDGREPTEIARLKGIQVGEIDLIRGLEHFVKR